MRALVLILVLGVGEASAQGFESLADRADRIAASYGVEPMPYVPSSAWVDWSPYMPPVVNQSRRRHTTRPMGGSSFYTPYDHVRPIRNHTPFPPTGPVRMLRGAGGEVLPEYLIPYGRRGNYRFAGMR